jgi:hypothetical protein
MNAIQTNLQGLGQKEISRKELLMIAGLAVLSIFGMETILRLIASMSLDVERIIDRYGSPIYGDKELKGSV